MTDKLETDSSTKHEEFNEANDDSQVAQSVREILQHAHRHVSDAIDADKNNYGESAVRSYSLAMDYFKTYLKMNDIGSSGGKFGTFRVFARCNSCDGKKTFTRGRSEDLVLVSIKSSSLCVFRSSLSSSLCVFVSLAMTYKNGRLRDVYEDADGRTFLGFCDKVVVFRFFLSSMFSRCFRLSFSFSFSLTFRSND